MNTCPCCSNQLLRHARRSGVYWFCPRCWQEMPVFAEAALGDRGALPKSRFDNSLTSVSSNLHKGEICLRYASANALATT